MKLLEKLLEQVGLTYQEPEAGVPTRFQVKSTHLKSMTLSWTPITIRIKTTNTSSCTTTT